MTNSATTTLKLKVQGERIKPDPGCWMLDTGCWENFNEKLKMKN